MVFFVNGLYGGWWEYMLELTKYKELDKSSCPLFVPASEGMGANKANCGNCGRWDADRERCLDEEKLKKKEV